MVLWTGHNVVLPGATAYSRAYAAIPEAAPALAAVLTGRYPHASGVLREGMPIRAGEPCLAAELARAGYRTAYTGRWPLGSGSPAQHGFDVWSPAPRLDRPFFLHVHGEPLPPLPASTVAAAVTLSAGPEAKVQLSARWPLTFPQDRLLSQIDIMPTLLGLCGVETPDGVHGRNLAAARPESVFLYGALGTPGEWRTIVRGLDKLTVNAAMEPLALYNLGQDPAETANLAQDPAHQRLRDELTAHMTHWLRRIEYGMDPSGLRIR